MKTLKTFNTYQHKGYQWRPSRLVYLVHPGEFPWRFPLVGYYPSPELAALTTPCPTRLFEVEVDPTDVIPPRLVREVELPTYNIYQRIYFAELVSERSGSIDAQVWHLRALGTNSTYDTTRAVQCAAHALGHTLGGVMGADNITFQEEIKCIS